MRVRIGTLSRLKLQQIYTEIIFLLLIQRYLSYKII